MSMTDKPAAPGDQESLAEEESQVNGAEGEQGEAGPEKATEAEVDSELMDMQFALAAAEKELAEHREAMLRMQAEMENLRKRLIKDLERSRLRSLEGFMNDLLPVCDSLERGIETDEKTATVESMKEGKMLIIRMLGKVMGDHGLSVIDPLGDAFNPELHEAMTVQESTEFEPDCVMEVLQKGFQLHDRLIRPARVVVAKAPEGD